MAGITTKTRSFKTINASNLELSQVQDNISAVFNQLLSCPLLNGILVENVSLASGDNTIEHSLGRNPRYIVVKQSAATTLYDKQASNPIPSKTLILNSSAAATVSLYLF